MRTAQVIAIALAGLLLAAAASAETLTVGVAAPLSGSSALLGRQVETGAKLAASSGTEVRMADDACTAESGAAAAGGFVKTGVKIAIGFLCTESIEAAAPILGQAGIPIITVGARTESLTERRARTGWQISRLAPRGDDERNAAAAMVARLWKDRLFAIIDDGTIYGRELAETVRAQAERAGLKPVFVDTFRPGLENQIALVGRLRRAGATHIFVGGDAEDVAIMGRDARALAADMVFAGGEALRAPTETPLAAGTEMVALPEWADVADRRALDIFRAAGALAEGYALPAYAAIEVAEAAAAEAARSGKTLDDVLPAQEFSTAIGPIRFNDKGDLTHNPYRIWRFDGRHFTLAGEE